MQEVLICITVLAKDCSDVPLVQLRSMTSLNRNLLKFIGHVVMIAMDSLVSSNMHRGYCDVFVSFALSFEIVLHIGF